MYMKNKMFLCLSDVNQTTVSSELKKKLTGTETFRLIMEMRYRHNGEPSQ